MQSWKNEEEGAVKRHIADLVKDWREGYFFLHGRHPDPDPKWGVGVFDGPCTAETGPITVSLETGVRALLMLDRIGVLSDEERGEWAADITRRLAQHPPMGVKTLVSPRRGLPPEGEL